MGKFLYMLCVNTHNRALGSKLHVQVDGCGNGRGIAREGVVSVTSLQIQGHW